MTDRERLERAERARARVCAIFDACRRADGPRGTRDAALVSVLFGANVPRSRALDLPHDAYDPGTGLLRPGPGGEGAEGLVLQASSGAREVLDEWREARGSEPGPLFCPVEDDGTVRPAEGLAASEVDAILDHWAGVAEIDRYRVNDFRRFYRSPWWTVLEG